MRERGHGSGKSGQGVEAGNLVAFRVLIVACLLAGLIGVTLGVLGGGGSILTVPLLAYVIGLDAKVAIASALPVVGTTSIVGALQQSAHGHVELWPALRFGAVAMVGAYAATFAAEYLSGTVQLVLLAFMMIGSAYSMLSGRSPTVDDAEHRPLQWGRMVPIALGVGSLTGLVGAGGGFIVVPALVVLAHVSMRQAVGTSLVVIAMNCAAAFVGYIGKVEVPWRLVAALTLAAVTGILLGSCAARRLAASTLRRGFGWFLIAMSVFILYRSRDVFFDLRDALASAGSLVR